MNDCKNKAFKSDHFELLCHKNVTLHSGWHNAVSLFLVVHFAQRMCIMYVIYETKSTNSVMDR